MYDVPAFDQITVQPGDCIGLHYPSYTSSGITVSIRKKATDTDPIGYGLTLSELSRFRTRGTFDEALPIGFQIRLTKQTDKIKLPSLRAYVTPTGEN